MEAISHRRKGRIEQRVFFSALTDEQMSLQCISVAGLCVQATL